MNTITVIIASYRYGHLAAQAIESVLAQTLAPEKIIVVDDGVGDCHHIAQIYPDVELIERPQNLGIVPNFNDALQRVQTQRCMFLGADNWLRPDALEILDAVEADIVSSDIAVTGDDAKPFCQRVGAVEVTEGCWLWRFTKGDIDRGNYIHGSSLYDVQKAKEAGGYAPSRGARSEEDWVLFRRMLRNGASHIHVPLPLLFYRRHRRNFNGNA